MHGAERVCMHGWVFWTCEMCETLSWLRDVGGVIVQVYTRGNR